MKKIVLSCFLLLAAVAVTAQTTESYTKKGKTLLFINQDPQLQEDTKEGLIKTYFKVFPKLVRDFNPATTDTITVTIDTSYDGVAYAHDGKITISSQWLHKKPKDTDVITHEVMHIVQAYPNGSGPGWLTEGIADYVRYKYGVDNKGSEWSLPGYSEKQSYENSYRITARFLLWITKNYDKQFVRFMDAQMRNKAYSDHIWKERTGLQLEELWNAYSMNPTI
ncbi:MAG: basic secretory protein-like protein [Sediminicola sp.]